MTEIEMQFLKDLLMPLIGAIVGYITGHSTCKHMMKKKLEK